MANYFAYSVIEVTDPEQVGVSSGNNEAGDTRICVSLTGIKINPELEGYDWIALTPECARDLYEMLGCYKHLWENLEHKNGQH